MEHELGDLECPKCKSRVVRRSRHLSFFSRLMCKLKGQQPYRCLNCDNRFMIYTNPEDDRAPKPAA